ncbi:MAG: intradiol ring-cleavage dioxygenase [Nitrospirae bacterium]|nr:intradiol ring-cleavage dioxygenase [Candidatus Manganitrophaceae bacterium]
MLGLIGTAAITILSGCGPNSGPRWWRRLWSGKTAAASIPPCIVRPEQTEGPYFVDEKLNRADIRSDPSDGSVKEGLPLRLTIRVHEITNNACTPLAGARVDLWHCDAAGVYSDVRDRSFDTRGKKFLRGYQTTDTAGKAVFLTIYPGWYQGRTVHIHFKIRTAPESRRGYEFTSQIYFDDAQTDQIHAHPPYNTKGQRTVKNQQDGIFNDGGPELILQMTQEADGYAGTFDIGLEMT